MNGIFGSMFGRIEPGLCRLGVNGGIAVKAGKDYKVYNVKTGKLTNCDNFVFNIGEEFFFVIPTNNVKKGDIILVNGKPRCVVEVEKNKITVVNYEDSTMEVVIPERHVVLGNTYMYGKIVSMFGDNPLNGTKGSEKIMKYLMMTEMMKGFGGASTTTTGGMSSLLPLMMMSGENGFADMFSGMFNFGTDEDSDSETVNDTNESEEKE